MIKLPLHLLATQTVIDHIVANRIGLDIHSDIPIPDVGAMLKVENIIQHAKSGEYAYKCSWKEFRYILPSSLFPDLNADDVWQAFTAKEEQRRKEEEEQRRKENLPSSLFPDLNADDVWQAFTAKEEQRRKEKKQKFKDDLISAQEDYYNDPVYIIKLRQQIAVSSLNGLLSSDYYMEAISKRSFQLNIAIEDAVTQMAIRHADELIRKLMNKKLEL